VTISARRWTCSGSAAAPRERSGQFDGPLRAGRIFVLIDRGDYWQCAYVIPKGTIEDVRRAGLEAFRAGLAQSMPMFADRVGELSDWTRSSC